jgi:ankyrin repeat protein
VGAHETDQFTVPVGWQFADIGDELTALYYDTIERGVSQLNDRIRDGRETGRSDAYAARLQTPDAVANPGRITGHWESINNLYRDLYLPIDPRLLWRIWHASTMNVYGSYFGPDKIGHFNDMGYVYYLIYRGAIDKGLSDREAILKVLSEGMNGLVLGERGMLGYFTAGSYSNADLAANLVGMKFYLNLTAETRLKGRLEPPMVIRDGDFWTLSPHVRRDSEFFAVFVSDHFNEALNPSLWQRGMRDKVRKAVRNRSERLREFYADDNGNRRPRAHFDDLIEELSTYYGEDYGYNGPYDDLVTIGNTCLETLPDDAPPDTVGADGTTPLHQAARDGDTARAQALLEAGAAVDAPMQSLESRSSEWGSTPLHAAAAAGRTEMIRLLLDQGADVHRANTRGVTPLHKAIGHAESVEILAARGADVNAEDERGRTALHWLARYPDRDSFRALITAGADVNATDHAGETALHRAALWGQAPMIRDLIDAGASVDARADYDTTVMHFAVRQDAPAIIELLLDEGADVDAADEFGLTPLHDVARNGSTRLAETLLANGADVGTGDEQGSTALHVAVRHNRETMASVLLTAGANVNAASDSGSRPLHEAAFVGRPVLVNLLLKHGARVGSPNTRGQTPLDLARAHDHTLAALLLSSSLAREETLVRSSGISSPFGLP